MMPAGTAAVAVTFYSHPLYQAELRRDVPQAGLEPATSRFPREGLPLGLQSRTLPAELLRLSLRCILVRVKYLVLKDSNAETE